MANATNNGDGTTSKNKRFYWLKLPEGYFAQKEIKRLRKIAGGDTFTIIYLKMLLRSLQNDGKLYFEGYDDNFASELALDLDENVDNIEVTIKFLLTNNLMIRCNDYEYELLTAHEMTGSETDVARRMRLKRDMDARIAAAEEAKRLTEAPHNVRECAEMCANVRRVREDIHKEKECMYSKTEDEDTHRDTIGNSDFNSNSKCSIYTDDDGNTYTDDYYDDVPPPDDDYCPPDDSNGGFFLYYDEEHDNDTLDTEKDKGNDDKDKTTNTTTNNTTTNSDYWRPNPNRPGKDVVTNYMTTIAKRMNKDVDRIDIDDEVREFYNMNDDKAKWTERSWKFWIERWVSSPKFGQAKSAVGDDGLTEYERIMLNRTYVC